jgi:hypothetical protein
MVRIVSEWHAFGIPTMLGYIGDLTFSVAFLAKRFAKDFGF